LFPSLGLNVRVTLAITLTFSLGQNTKKVARPLEDLATFYVYFSKYQKTYEADQTSNQAGPAAGCMSTCQANDWILSPARPFYLQYNCSWHPLNWDGLSI